MLAGRRISSVQRAALQILMAEEALEEGRKRFIEQNNSSWNFEPVPDVVQVEVTEENYDDPGITVFDTTTEDVEEVMAQLGFGGMIEE